MDPAQVQATQEWKTPSDGKEFLAFIGFANFYRRFIFKFSTLTGPLTYLTRTKDAPAFTWMAEYQKVFEDLKYAFTTAPILSHFIPGREIILETDASGYDKAAILSQRGEDGKFHP